MTRVEPWTLEPELQPSLAFLLSFLSMDNNFTHCTGLWKPKGTVHPAHTPNLFVTMGDPWSPSLDTFLTLALALGVAQAPLPVPSVPSPPAKAGGSWTSPGQGEFTWEDVSQGAVAGSSGTGGDCGSVRGSHSCPRSADGSREGLEERDQFQHRSCFPNL